MPTGAVYQPTTVTYEQQTSDQRWNCPISYFSRRITSSLNRTAWARLGICFLGGALVITGLVLIIVGSVAVGNTPPALPSDGIGVLIAGGVLFSLGALFAGVGGWAWSAARYGVSKEAVRSPGGTTLNGLNPSTDPLVAGQYAPVRDAPPAPDDETRNLMDNKDCLSSAEESDKMLDCQPTSA